MQNNIRLAIIGGGPGGLTLARVLFTRGIAATVFELDAHALHRPQGGSLDLHPESGLYAVRTAGLEQEFRAVARYDDQEDRLYDMHGTLLHANVDNAARDRPEIDRTQLRQMLLASLPETTVRWGCKVRGIEPLADNQYRVHGDEVPLGDFDLVIGADGTWSRVRPLVSQAVPSYSGVTFFELMIDDIDARHPELARVVGHGKMFAVGKERAIIAQRSSNSHVRVYLSFRVLEDFCESGAIDRRSPARTKLDLKQHFEGFSPSLLAFIDAASEVIAPRPLYALPVGHSWPHRKGVTLLGDAAHVMSPFGGEGVNLAMQDATELALKLAETSDFDLAVRNYEREMFTRAEKAAAEAAEGIDSFDGPIDELQRHFDQMMQPAQEAERV